MQPIQPMYTHARTDVAHFALKLMLYHTHRKSNVYEMTVIIFHTHIVCMNGTILFNFSTLCSIQFIEAFAVRVNQQLKVASF